MAAIAALVARILALLLEVLSGVQAIRSIVDALKGTVSNTAVESTPYHIDSTVTGLDTYARSSVTGLPAILATVNAVRLDMNTPHLPTISDVLDAITGLTPVTLPTTPPPGYGGGWEGTVTVAQLCGLD